MQELGEFQIGRGERYVIDSHRQSFGESQVNRVVASPRLAGFVHSKVEKVGNSPAIPGPDRSHRNRA